MQRLASGLSRAARDVAVASRGRDANMAARAFSAAIHDAIGSKSFTDATMKSMVSANTYAEFKAGIVESKPLSSDAKKELTNAVKEWALGKGCTKFAHYFTPIRMGDGRAQSAYKLDGFVDLDFGNPDVLKPIVGKAFGGRGLFESETDGSSFPNGGLRITHRAAAFMSWDKSSPPYVVGDTLFIPSAFATHNGHALDHKTPLLRSQAAINREGMRLLKHLGDSSAKFVVSNVGWEQEYFLITTENYCKRPDLQTSGRTLFGAPSPRNQEGCENYFGTPSSLVKAFMDDVTDELWELNVALSVNHNEVAPSQHELSPIFSLTNVAADNNILCLEVMDKVAAKYGLKVLCHEKPFAGINGSGKHSNWGLNTDSGKNLYKPGKTETTQGDFFAFVAALSHAIANYSELLRCGVAHAGNDHRLGAQEAPPAIISLYTGDIMEAHIRKIIEGGPLFGYPVKGDMLNYGSGAVEEVERGLEDRNRTAPFPFCGNRFEFRAVGSSQNIATPLAYLNTAVAEGCAVISAKIEGGMAPRDAIAATYKENMHAIFNGNGYSDEWPVEAAKRGLPNLKDTPSALAHFNSEKNKALFTKMGVFTVEEVDARQETFLEEYSGIILQEAEISLSMVNTKILPTCAADLKAYEGTGLAGGRAAAYKAVATEVEKLAAAVHGAPEGSALETATYFANTVKPQMSALREAVDGAEGLCSNWPFPSYQEMLFPHHAESIE